MFVHLIEVTKKTLIQRIKEDIIPISVGIVFPIGYSFIKTKQYMQKQEEEIEESEKSFKKTYYTFPRKFLSSVKNTLLLTLMLNAADLIYQAIPTNIHQDKHIKVSTTRRRYDLTNPSFSENSLRSLLSLTNYYPLKHLLGFGEKEYTSINIKFQDNGDNIHLRYVFPGKLRPGLIPLNNLPEPEVYVDQSRIDGKYLKEPCKRLGERIISESKLF